MNLTLEQQRKLTEFLGETWSNGWFGDCPKCGASFEWLGATEDKQEPSSSGCFCTNCAGTVKGIVHFERKCLDFTDWRVVGRLATQMAAYHINHINNEEVQVIVWDDKGEDFVSWGNTPQEAICRAVLAWIEEK